MCIYFVFILFIYFLCILYKLNKSNSVVSLMITVLKLTLKLFFHEKEKKTPVTIVLFAMF